MLKELRTKHREVARLSFQGFSPQEIAERTDITAGTVYKILKDPMCKSFISGLMDQADRDVINTRKELIKLEPLAIDVYRDILKKDSNAPASVQLNAAKDVFDRNGYKVPEQHNHLVTHMTTEDILKLAKERQKQNIKDIN